MSKPHCAKGHDSGIGWSFAAGVCGLDCRGDDLGGAPRAGQYASWRPRKSHGLSARRPAPPEEPAVLAAGWRLHRGGLEPGDGDKTPPTAVSPKAERPRQDRQERRTGVTNATTTSDQWETEDPSLRWDPRQRRGDMPSRCRPREKALYKVPLPERGQRRWGQGRRRRGAGSRPKRYQNL
jgi:hypothetical protein